MAKETTSSSHGYDNNFTCDTEKYMCPVCLLVFHDAMQTPCGHRFCQPCIGRVIGESDVLKCPIDKQLSRQSQIFPDVAIRREVLSLGVRCSHDECTWQGELREYENHKNNCQMEEVPCPFGCSTLTQRQNIDSHILMCPSRNVNCEYCLDPIQYKEVEAHQASSCIKFPMSCPLCQEEGILREDLLEHKDPISGSCPEAVINCPYNGIGCEFTTRRLSMDDHLVSPSSIASHLNVVSQRIWKLDAANLGMKHLVTNISTKMAKMERDLLNMHRRADGFSRQLSCQNITGQLHWKIDLRRRPVYNSPIFYTGCPGYKVQVFLDTRMSRDGNDRVSGFGLRLLRGAFDNEMMWPFNATCYFTLLDQKGGSKPRNSVYSVVVREVPRKLPGNDPTDRSFVRGMVKLIKREELLGPQSRFIKNNALFAEVSVVHCVYPTPEEASGSPVPSLSPGPVHRLVMRHVNPEGGPYMHNGPLTPNSPTSPIFHLASFSLNNQQ